MHEPFVSRYLFGVLGTSGIERCASGKLLKRKVVKPENPSPPNYFATFCCDLSLEVIYICYMCRMKTLCYGLCYSRASLHTSIQRHHIISLKSARLGVLTPGRWGSTTNQALIYVLRLSRK